MTNLDVSLRLRLENQLSRPAEAAEKDLNALRQTAERLGRTKGADELARDLKSAGASAGRSASEIDQMRLKLSGVSKESHDAKQAISRIGDEAKRVKTELGRMDDNAFAGLKADAKQAEQAIERIGHAAKRVRDESFRGARPGNSTTMPHGPMTRPAGGRSSLSTAAEAAYDSLGLDTTIMLTGGAAYTLGTGVAAGGLVAGATLKSAADAEFRSDQLAVTGGYNAARQAQIDKTLREIGARRGVGEGGAQSVFGTLISGGMSESDALPNTDRGLKLSVAAAAKAEDVAAMTIAMMDNMGIRNDQLDEAYDAAAYGGKAGKFELKDMAGNFPEILANMNRNQSKGLEGFKLATAMSQSVVKKSGSPDQAATNLNGLLNDLLSPDVVKRLKDDYKINVPAIRNKAVADGVDPMMAVLDRLHKTVGTDSVKLGDIFRNQEGNIAITAVMTDLADIKTMMSEMGKAKGTVDQDYARATDNVNSQFDRLSSRVAKDAKSVAEPVLPYITSTLKPVNDYLDTLPEKREQNAAQAEKLRQQLNGPINWKKFMFGAAADPGFSLKEHMSNSFKDAGSNSMQSLADGMKAQRETAIAEATGIADRIKALFGFTVSPTIQPTFVAPSGPPVSGRGGSVTSASAINLTQHIHSPNSKAAARAAQREQNRSVRNAKNRSLADTGGNIP